MLKVKTPLLADCPVNIEREIALESHTMFIRFVQAVHTEGSLLDEHCDADVVCAQRIIHDNGTVREKPTYKFRVDGLGLAVWLK